MVPQFNGSLWQHRPLPPTKIIFGILQLLQELRPMPPKVTCKPRALNHNNNNNNLLFIEAPDKRTALYIYMLCNLNLITTNRTDSLHGPLDALQSRCKGLRYARLAIL